MIVLLKVACTCATPSGTERRTRLRRGAGAAAAPAAGACAPPAPACAPPPALCCPFSAAAGLPFGASLVSFSSAIDSPLKIQRARQRDTINYPFGGADFLP